MVVEALPISRFVQEEVVHTTGPRIDGKILKPEEPKVDLTPYQKAQQPGGVLYKIFDTFSEIYTSHTIEKRKSELRQELGKLKREASRKNFKLPHDFEDRAKRIKIYR